MAKGVIKNYTFNTSTKAITLTDIATVRLDKLALITDVTTNKILYNFADSTVATATVSTNVITLSVLQGGEANSDKLRIDYDIESSDTSAFTDTSVASTLQSGSTTAVTQGTATNLKTQSETYQGGSAVASGNPLEVNLRSSTLSVATSTKQSDGSQKTQVVDGSGNVIGATSNALDVNIKSGNPSSITANAGTNLNTSALALDTSVNGILVAQNSTTSGQSGPIVQTATTTSAPTYTTAKTNPLNTTTAGALRTDESTIAGTTVDTNSGTKSAGTQRIVIATDQPSLTNAIPVSDNSGSFTVDAPVGTPVFVTATPSTTGGWSKIKYAAQTTSVVTPKGTAATFGGYFAYNPNSTVAYIQVFDAATATTITLGTTVPDMIFGIPANSGANLEITLGVNMANGIKLACTTTATGNTAPGTGLDLTIFYK